MRSTPVLRYQRQSAVKKVCGLKHLTLGPLPIRPTNPEREEFFTRLAFFRGQIESVFIRVIRG
jgi:hypothetical protein